MGDSHCLDTSLAYPHPYQPQHTSRIHSEAAIVDPVPPPPSLCPSGPPPPSPPPPLLQQLPPHLQLDWRRPPQSGTSPTTTTTTNDARSFPTVIVSPSSSSHHHTGSDRHPKHNSVKSTKARQQLHGNNIVTQGVYRDAPAMTSNGSSKHEGANTMRSQSQRPSLVSQHSNSVPSTPHQYPREFASRSRSPSPNGGLGSHSPRSVTSEANGTLPSLRRARGSCKFETNAAFGRRRILYHSAEILEKAKEEPKKFLDPHEDEKLSGDMRELYDRLLPSQESMDRRRQFVQKLEDILHEEWPGNEFKVHVFGSSGNLLFTDESDVDVCIQTPMHKLEEMHMLAEALAKHGMEKVVCVPGAKVRIVKIWDPELELACDMNVNNTLALDNTRMIKTYVKIDERVRPLAMIIKYWTKRRILNDAAIGGTISSYTWICMILNFLQTREPPILPSLHKLPYRTIVQETGEPSSFADDLEKLDGYGKDNKETIGQLLFAFFRRYGHEIDYEKSVVSVREGRLMTRAEKEWDVRSLKKEGRNRLCVEEPFNTERNLGNSADDYSWHGIHLEIRRAFDLLADGGQLDKACEQYEYPQDDKPIFKKPTPTIKPILTSVPIRSGRGGSNRGSRGGYSQKGGNHAYQRRSSSGAAFGNNRPPFLHSPPISAGPGQEYFVRGLNEQLHDQLYQQYQLLEMQSNSLRAQLVAQQRAQQHAHAQQAHVQAAHMHAHAVAQQAQAQHRGQSTNGSPQKSPYVNGNGTSSPHLPEMLPHSIPPAFLYQYPGFYNSPESMLSQDNPRTNPSSPSLPNSIPGPGLRRTVHRSSNASDTGSTRSHSQPARPGAPGYAQFPYLDPSTFAGYPIARSSQDIPPVAGVEAPFNHVLTENVISSDHGTPKEYVGYYVEETPQVRPRQLQEYAVPQIPTYDELAQRRSRVSPEAQPLLTTGLRRASRSPSPLGSHVRSYSIGVAPPAGSKPAQHSPPQEEILVIANGSYPAHEPRSRSGTGDALSSATDARDPSALGIYVNHADPYRMISPEQRQQLLMADELSRRQSEIMQGGPTNGAMSNAADSNALTRVSSGGKQPFPQLPESWMNYDAMNGDVHTADISPTRGQAHPWRAAQYPNGLNVLDTTNAPRPPPQEPKSAGLPLLSPVFETRTPSPTANRQVNGFKAQTKENQVQVPPRPAQVQENNRVNPPKPAAHTQEKAKGNSSANQSQGNWQHQTQKKRSKKSKSNGQKQGNESKGQPLPVNEADRKGG